MYRFESKHHIRQASEFVVVKQQGKRIVDLCFVFIYLKAKRDYPRLGMVIGKKHCPLAVNRNRLKRIIRETFRLNQHRLSAIDLVVALKSPLVEPTELRKLSDQEQSECIKNLFAQLIARCDGL